MRHIEDAGGGADGMMLGQDPAGVLHRHLPAGKGNHLGPQLLVRFEQSGASERRGSCHVFTKKRERGENNVSGERDIMTW